jgi:hypothetical protein
MMQSFATGGWVDCAHAGVNDVQKRKLITKASAAIRDSAAGLEGIRLGANRVVGLVGVEKPSFSGCAW